MGREFPILAGGEFLKTASPCEIKSPYDRATVGITWLAGEPEVEKAVRGAVDSFAITKKMPHHERAGVLSRISAFIAARKEEIARVMAAEAGKAISAARGELERTVFTFQYAAEEAKRLHGEIVPLDAHPLGGGHTCFVRRVPIGPVLGITPFNFPMNLVAHKVAPAIAAGNPIVIKPAPQAPLTALMLAEAVMESGLPKGAFSVIPASNTLAERMVEDERFRMVSFTGSPSVGWGIKRRAGKKKVVLELGGNAGVIVCADADIEDAAARIAIGGFIYSGQVCISVQRIFVQRPVYGRFRDIFLEKVKSLKTGDPLEEETVVGPLISEKDATRVEEWIGEARAAGATIACGGGRKGSIVEPTVLENTTPDMKVNCLEIFGPVVTLVPFDDLEDAFSSVNDSSFGLQAGIFTNSLKAAMRAWDILEVGGVNVNQVPTFRIDHMPYGGMKDSGFGREGIRYAIEEMTELRNLVINNPA